MHASSSQLGASRQIVEDTQYWERLQSVLGDLALRGEYRAAVPHLDGLAERLALVGDADRVCLPMMGEYLDPHRQLAERSLFRVANQMWELDRLDFPDDFTRSPRRRRFMSNVAKVAARTGERSGLYHFIVAAASAEATAAAAMDVKKILEVVSLLRERSLAM